MTYSVEWARIAPNARRQAIIGAANRFRVWQAVRVLGTEATTEEIQDYVGLERTAVFNHLRDLNIKLVPVRKSRSLFDMPIDEFMSRPSDGLHLMDTVLA